MEKEIFELGADMARCAADLSGESHPVRLTKDMEYVDKNAQRSALSLGGKVRNIREPENELPLKKRIELLEQFVHDLAQEFPPIKQALSDLFTKIG